MTCVLMGTLKPTQSLTHSLTTAVISSVDMTVTRYSLFVLKLYVKQLFAML